MSMDELRQAALARNVRFELVEHGGKFFAIRQTNSRIAKSVSEHKVPQARVVQMVIEVTHEALPAIGPDGVQLKETILTPQTEPVLKDGEPVLETVNDPKGRPIILEGKPFKRAKMQPTMKDGEQVVTETERPKFTLGRPVFDPTFFDTLMEEPSDEGSFLHKVALAAARVNDREDAKDLAKKS